MAPDTSVDATFDLGYELGFHGALVFSALVDAAAIWALLRYVARRREAGGAQVQRAVIPARGRPMR